MNKFDDPKKLRVDFTVSEKEDFGSDSSEQYGTDYYLITEKEIEELKKGKALSFDVQGEYTCHVALKR